MSGLAGCLGRVDGALHVARVVERIEDAENVHAVVGRACDKGFDHIVREVCVLHDVLSAKQHHVRCVFGQAFLSVSSRSKGNSSKKRRPESMVAPPHVSRAPKPPVVERSQTGSICPVVHAGGGETLMTVAQDVVVELDGFQGFT